MLSALLFFCLVGSVAGVIAGLFGIGGGVVIVPALITSLSQQGAIAVELLKRMLPGLMLGAVLGG